MPSRRCWRAGPASWWPTVWVPSVPPTGSWWFTTDASGRAAPTRSWWPSGASITASTPTSTAGKPPRRRWSDRNKNRPGGWYPSSGLAACSNRAEFRICTSLKKKVLSRPRRRRAWRGCGPARREGPPRSSGRSRIWRSGSPGGRAARPAVPAPGR